MRETKPPQLSDPNYTPQLPTTVSPTQPEKREVWWVAIEGREKMHQMREEGGKKKWRTGETRGTSEERRTKKEERLKGA